MAAKSAPTSWTATAPNASTAENATPSWNSTTYAPAPPAPSVSTTSTPAVASATSRRLNRPIEAFLADQPELLEHILERLQRSNLASAAHVNAALPAIVQSLRATGLPVQLTDAESVSWARDQLGIPKTHCYVAALQGRNFTSVVSLPTQVLQLQLNNGRSKQKAKTDHATAPPSDGPSANSNGYPNTCANGTPRPATPTVTNATANS